jgi:hypothetical protein
VSNHHTVGVTIIIIIILHTLMINVARDHSFAFVEIAQSAHIKVSLGM